ncbi:MAG: hypothetical protein JWL59_4715 [Chthoniobacteraceae bacterium]|nr:hypothetical protein [Chthoniobacteraceae bacterium]
MRRTSVSKDQTLPAVEQPENATNRALVPMKGEHPGKQWIFAGPGNFEPPFQQSTTPSVTIGLARVIGKEICAQARADFKNRKLRRSLIMAKGNNSHKKEVKKPKKEKPKQQP